MKISRSFDRRQFSIRKCTAGVTLVVAVVALAMVMVLLLALFQGVLRQTHGGQSAGTLAHEKMLADSAVALVIGQIKQASTQTGQTWISQPGLLRTYDASASRKPTACYKLYSSNQMIDTTGSLTFLSTDVPTDWNSTANRSVYVDLNSPAQTSSFLGQTLYPILDLAAATNVEGISIDTGHDVSMPVVWLYQLQDGTFGPASNGTKANPIVARIAFWTDDDSNKIDINTAGCGSGWNTPRANSTDDVTWSTDQPASGEYPSYPGHPATTSLAPVFGQGTSGLSPQQLLSLTPRYAWGGSQFCTQATTSGEIVPPKVDRLYASIDELCFSSGFDSSYQRAANPVTPSQISVARFALTAHSQSPETTLLGEPRIAIWPVSDVPQDSTRTTAHDRAVENDATIGTKKYFFQRHKASSATDDLDGTIIPSNAQLFSDLVARGATKLPGYGVSLTAKYTGATWTQLILEITDFIRCLNAVDPSPAPFVSYAAGDSTGMGRGFIVPLTTTYGSGASAVTLRGLGRCPTLSSLTLVMYVCGFGFKDGSSIDYETTPDDAIGTSWTGTFATNSGTNRWKDVTSELVRAFVVPCTYQPGCGYPEVSDACDIQISGLDGIKVSSNKASGDFGFAATSHSRLLGDALTVLPQERAWGGNEGPLAWRAASLDATSASANYPFAGTKAFAVPLDMSKASGSTPIDTTSPDAWMQSLTFNGVSGLVVRIRDRNGNTLQTLNVDLPKFTAAHAPTINGECDHADGTTVATSKTTWATDSASKVAPSYYMNLQNRLRSTQLNRAMFIQVGDISRSVEAKTDLRVIAGLPTVPSTMFQTYAAPVVYTQGGSHAHNLRFADGTSVCFASGTIQLINTSYPNPSLTGSMTATDWRDSSSVAYTWAMSPACGAPTGTKYVTMQPTQNIYGDWDTGPGFAPDGAQIGLPDSGTTLDPATAYFSLTGGQVGAATQRTPNALVPSPVVFGSLPAGINPTQPAQSEPWRTLLFCPYPAEDATHPGFTSPPDHLILDNFWMPTVEPYAISGCMTTAGKINLNDQIAPFTWIHRNTGLHALLAGLRIPAIAPANVQSYKSPGSTLGSNSIWKAVNETLTLAQIENRFANGSTDAYLSESEICTVPLVPNGTAPNTVAKVQTALDAFWNGFQGGGRLTGDNLRELPYAQLYSRLTTRSNSYTVHVRVQVLQKLPLDPNQNVWNEGVDLVQGDWRGSYEIERYLDPTASAPVAGQPLGPYRFRIVSSRRFAP